jgi:hypothetical protein
MKIVRLKQALYEDLFLLNESDVDHLINYKIKDFDPVESIRFSSFLNMICQTIPIDNLLQLQIRGTGRLFKKSDMINLYLNPKIIYHRDNLLHYICRIISRKVNGSDKITGKGISSNPNLWKYGKVLLLINNKINILAYQQDFEREIIKSFPFYFPERLFRLFTQRIIRYSYIYKHILHRIKQNQKTVLLSGINLIEKKYNIKFDDYIDTIKELFIWFLGIKETGLNSARFDMKNKETFYINKERFKGTQVIPTLEALSRDIRGFCEEFNIKRKDEIDNDVFCYFQSIFDYPIFKNDIEFCIIDFKFLIEGICSGLIWKIESILKNNNKINHNMQEIRGQYGNLLEEYFVFLMNKIFPEINLTNNQEGKPDAVLEVNNNNENYIIIFEFTTKFYKISSLYNRTSENFKKDLTRMLFSNKRNDKGKFINLDKYMADYKKQNKIVIPILVTESWLGDYDLLNRIGNILKKKIQEHKLKNLNKFKPYILSLDDMETFWAISTKGKEGKEFITSLEIWEKIQKGKFLYNFANFVSEEGRFNNQEYLNFFDAHNLAN